MRGLSRPKDGVAPRIHEAAPRPRPYGCHLLHFIMDYRIIGERSDAVLRPAMPRKDARRGRRITERRQASMISGSFRQNGLRSVLGSVSPKCSPGLRQSLRKSAASVLEGLPLIVFHQDKLHRSGGACARPPLGIFPRSEGAKRRQALVRNAAPGGLALRQSPSLQRKGTAGP